MQVTRLVSGGQTGVDRAALEVARELGLEHGGWCPRGGWAEDHPRPPGLLARYPALRETPSAAPEQRTRWNVRDSDATLVVSPPSPPAHSPGTRLTECAARELGRPLLVVAPTEADRVRRWLAGLDGATLNVAGPRESEAPGVERATRALLSAVLVG